MVLVEETVGFALAQTCKWHRNRTDAALKQIDLHVGQEMVLLQLWAEEGLPQSRLVERMCIEPPTLTKMLQRMEQEGMLTRRPDAEDARVSRVYLTERGRGLEPALAQAWAQVEAKATAGMTTEERLLLRRLLLQMRDNLVED